jgi:hypothetical protein
MCVRVTLNEERVNKNVRHSLRQRLWISHDGSCSTIIRSFHFAGITGSGQALFGIGVAGQRGKSAVDLLGKHDARKLV